MPIKKAQEKMDVEEIRVLRWMLGVMEMSRIRNERISGTMVEILNEV